MKLEQSFEVKAPLDRVWDALIDVERVAPCLPGAEVTGRNEDGSYDGSFKVKIGPTSAPTPASCTWARSTRARTRRRCTPRAPTVAGRVAPRRRSSPRWLTPATGRRG